jgi:hypothetical protein
MILIVKMGKHRIDNFSSIRNILGNLTVDGTITATGSVQTSTLINASNPINLPTTAGSVGQTLQTDGNGNLTWVTPTSGTSSSVASGTTSVVASSSVVTISSVNSVVATFDQNNIAFRDTLGNETFGVSGSGANAVTTVANTLALTNQAGNAVDIEVAPGQTASYPLVLPPAQATSAGQLLSNDGAGNLSWITNAAGTANNLAFASSSASTSTTLGANTLINVDATAGNVVITLPPQANYVGQQYIIYRVDASMNTVTIQPTSGETLQKITNNTINLVTQDDRVVLLTNGTRGWFTI